MDKKNRGASIVKSFSCPVESYELILRADEHAKAIGISFSAFVVSLINDFFQNSNSSLDSSKLPLVNDNILKYQCIQQINRINELIEQIDECNWCLEREDDEDLYATRCQNANLSTYAKTPLRLKQLKAKLIKKLSRDFYDFLRKVDYILKPEVDFIDDRHLHILIYNVAECLDFNEGTREEIMTLFDVGLLSKEALIKRLVKIRLNQT